MLLAPGESQSRDRLDPLLERWVVDDEACICVAPQPVGLGIGARAHGGDCPLDPRHQSDLAEERKRSQCGDRGFSRLVQYIHVALVDEIHGVILLTFADDEVARHIHLPI
eukprot:6838484-Prymnesium_polylepis.1